MRARFIGLSADRTMATASTFVANICGLQFQRGPALQFVSTGEELTLQHSLVLGLNTFTQSPVTGAVIDFALWLSDNARISPFEVSTSTSPLSTRRTLPMSSDRGPSIT